MEETIEQISTTLEAVKLENKEEQPNTNGKTQEEAQNASTNDDSNVSSLGIPYINFPTFSDIDSQHIVFYDIETTIPNDDVIEFGAIVLDRVGLFEIELYETLIFSPKITKKSIEANGITHEMVKDAPVFEKVADKIFNLLDGKIWAGHNILTFDNKHIVKEFQKLNMKPPTPAGLIDTLPLLKKTFGKRAGNMKMASLGHYFHLGEEQHRALEDCKMTVQVFKNCCMTLFLEEHVGTMTWPSKQRKSKPKKETTDTNTDDNNHSDNNNNSSTETPKKKTAQKTHTTTTTTPQSANKTTTKSQSVTTPLKIETEEEKQIKEKLDQAIAEKKPVWISYNGGTVPLSPRKIFPQQWNKNFVLAGCSAEDTKQFSFNFTKIQEIRDEKWLLPSQEQNKEDSSSTTDNTTVKNNGDTKE